MQKDAAGGFAQNSLEQFQVCFGTVERGFYATGWVVAHETGKEGFLGGCAAAAAAAAALQPATATCAVRGANALAAPVLVADAMQRPQSR